MKIKFNDFTNESINDIFNTRYTYIDKVKDNLISIIMDVNYVSEKDFKKVNIIIESTNEFMVDTDVLKTVLECEESGKRPQLCAELIFDEVVKNK